MTSAATATPTVVDLVRHVDALCRELGVFCRPFNGYEIRALRPLPAYVPDWLCGYAMRGAHMICIAPVRGEMSYYTALHELGHVATNIWSTTQNQVLSFLEDEHCAWAWAFSASLIPPGRTLRRLRAFALRSYYANEAARWRACPDAPGADARLRFANGAWAQLLQETLETR